MKNINQVIGSLPPARRAKIAGRTRQLIGEELALQQVRKARHLTQEQMARILKVGQDSISRLESRSDLLISTLRSYIEAMGGQMKIIVEFKEGTAVLSDFSPMDPPKVSRKPARRSVARKKGHLELLHPAE
jgi:DNA-binding XRE family transcriptional regulator